MSVLAPRLLASDFNITLKNDQVSLDSSMFIRKLFTNTPVTSTRLLKLPDLKFLGAYEEIIDICDGVFYRRY